MKLLSLLSACFIACSTPSDLHQTSSGEWSDKTPDFIGCVPHVDAKGGYADLIRYSKWGGYVVSYLNPVSDKWIRDPGNIMIVHNTLKCIGYKKFIPYSRRKKNTLAGCVDRVE